MKIEDERLGSGDGEQMTTMDTTDQTRAVACIRFVRLLRGGKTHSEYYALAARIAAQVSTPWQVQWPEGDWRDADLTHETLHWHVTNQHPLRWSPNKALSKP